MGIVGSEFLFPNQMLVMRQSLQNIRAKSSQTPDRVEDSTEFVNFFPEFIWTVWDFTLELQLCGQPITEDEYLENALKLIPGIRVWPGQCTVQ